jgi:hypothetical protein
MTFPLTPIPTNLTDDEYEMLAKLLAVHYAYPLQYPLAGGFFEELFAVATKAKRESRKLLFDVLRGNIGWSLKTLKVSRVKLSPGDSFEAVIQRCDILKDKDLSLTSPEPVLGLKILERFYGFCKKSLVAQSVADPRAGFLIRNSTEHDFVFFQQRYRLYAAEEVQWHWSNSDKNSLIGEVSGNRVLRWYRSGTQLFGIYRIPSDAYPFRIDWRKASLDKTIAFFTAEGIVQIEE